MSGLLGPIRVKRSTVSGEVPAAGDLVTGEIAGNTADGKLFIKHSDGTVKEISGGGGGSSTIDGLTDVTITNPTDNQILAYNSTSSEWENITGLNGAATLIVPFGQGYVDDASAGSGVGLTWGAWNSGNGNIVVTFGTAQPNADYSVTTDNESADDIYVSVSSKATTGFTLSTYDSNGNATSPATYPFSFQVYASDPTVTIGGTGAATIDDLADVDTSTVAPTDGQVLAWDNTAGQWEPVDASTGAVDSVNGQTGVVVLDADDIDDTSATHKFATAAQLSAADSAVQPTDSIDALSDVDTSTVAPTDGQALVWDNAAGQWEPGTVSGGGATVIDDLTDVDTSTVAPTDGQALIWDNANSKWEPGTVSGGGATVIDDLTDVDTSTVAPTDGQVLAWDNAASKWEPANGGSVIDIAGGLRYTNTTDPANVNNSLRFLVGSARVYVWDEDLDSSLLLGAVTPDTTSHPYVWMKSDLGWHKLTVTAWSTWTSSPKIWRVDLVYAECLTVGTLGSTIEFGVTEPAKAGDLVIYNGTGFETSATIPTPSIAVEDLSNFYGEVPSLEFAIITTGSQTPVDGEASNAHISNRFTVGKNDASGTSVDTILAADTDPSGAADVSLWYSEDKVTWTALTGHAYDSGQSYYEIVTAGQYWNPAGAISGWTTIYFANVDPASVSAPADGDVITFDGTLNQWKAAAPSGGGGGGASRSSIVTTTSSLADQASEDVVFTAAGKSGMFLTVETDRAARVVFYTSTAARTADAGRSSNIQPTSGSGVLLEVITAGLGTVVVSPSVNYFNIDSVVSSDMVAKIENRSGSSSAVEVTLQVLSLEP